jgi:hypothetical protein
MGFGAYFINYENNIVVYKIAYWVLRLGCGFCYQQIIIQFASRDDTSLQNCQTVFGAHLLTYSSAVNRPGRENDHSFPSSAEVKNGWSCISPSYLSS